MTEKKYAYAAHQIKTITPIKDRIIVSDMVFDQRTTLGGIVLMNDNGKSSGIRPRWAKVYAVGPEQQDVKVGDWVFVEHGRWGRGIEIEDGQGTKTVRLVDPECIMMISDKPMVDETMSVAV
jgi:co-chaperonin GroES (HSP10)